MPGCRVAAEATWCWHDVIKNRIQAFDDVFLEKWLRDTAATEEFQATLARVVAGLDGFSPACVAAQLAPIGSLTDPERTALFGRLEEIFQHEFRPAERRRRLRTVVDALNGALRACSQRTESEGRDRLAALRAAAIAVRRELEGLPRGFCLPHETKEKDVHKPA